MSWLPLDPGLLHCQDAVTSWELLRRPYHLGFQCCTCSAHELVGDVCPFWPSTSYKELSPLSEDLLSHYYSLSGMKPFIFHEMGEPMEQKIYVNSFEVCFGRVSNFEVAKH